MTTDGAPYAAWTDLREAGASHIFFATLPRGGKTDTAETLLTNHNCCSAIPATDLCCDLVPFKVMGKMFASIGAARRKEVTALTEVVHKAGSTFARIEAAPWALLRLPVKGKLAPTNLRLLVDGTDLIAVLAQGGHPLLWREMEVSPSASEAADAITSLVRTFETYASQNIGIEETLSITLQGENMPERLAERLQAELGAKFSPIDGPGPTPAAISRGLANGGLEWDKPALDLASSLAPPPQLADLVPYGELAIMAALVVCTGLWLWSAGNDVVARAIRVEQTNTRNAVFKTDDARLTQERTVVGAEVQAVQRFLSNRVTWTEYLNQLSARVPPTVTCASIQGDYELSTGGDKSDARLKKSLTLELTANLPKDVATPPEVDQAIKALRQSQVIRRDFPEINLSTLRVSHSGNRRAGVEAPMTDPASFIVMCGPKDKPKKDGAAAPPPKKEAKKE